MSSAGFEAQAKEDFHCRDTKIDITNEALVVSMGYKELSEHETSKKCITMIVCRDKWTTAIAAYVVKAKGSTEVSREIVEFLDSSGYNDIVFKSDNEAPIKALRDDVINTRVRPTRPGGSIPMHPQTHGGAEKVVQEIID